MRSARSSLIGALAGVALWLSAVDAQAVPSFARQSGLDCTTCHMSWLELTNIGRRFKLGGYQLMKSMPDNAQRPLVSFSFEDNPPQIPLAGMIQTSITDTAKTRTPGVEAATDFAKNDRLLLQQASLFLNGKLAEHVGCFCQWTYDGAAGHSSIDNFEVRVADDYTINGIDGLYGASLNNSPTMSDIYNTTPVWGWPYAGPTVAAAPSASTIINGGLAQTVVGLTAYTLINRTLYLEYGGYRTADGAFSFMRLGVPQDGRSAIDGVAPYYRLALQHDWDKGHQSAMVGTFGFTAKKFPDATDPVGPTDKFRDTGVDAQYQYITDAHRFSAMYTYIHEKQELNAAFASGAASNPTNTLNQINTKVSYYYNKWYGISVGYQSSSGSSDSALYDTGSPLSGSINAKPDSNARIVELNWLFSPSGAQTYRKNRIVLQYTSYSKFNGGTTNYDGFGRNARDNNALYLLGWFMY